MEQERRHRNRERVRKGNGNSVGGINRLGYTARGSLMLDSGKARGGMHHHVAMVLSTFVAGRHIARTGCWR